MCLRELLSPLSLGHKLDPAATGQWMLQGSKGSPHLFLSHEILVPHWGHLLGQPLVTCVCAIALMVKTEAVFALHLH